MSVKSSPTYEDIPSRTQVFEEVKRIVAESSGIPPEEIHESHTLLRDLPWDSLDIVECSMEIEEQFGVNVPDELVEQAKTVGDLVDGVLTLLAQPQPDS